MNLISKIPLILCTLILASQISSAEPLPLEEGKEYRIKLSAEEDKKIPYWDSNRSVKVTKIYDYPWVEIEYTWMPSAAYKTDKKGERQSVKPKPHVYRQLLNLNYVVTINRGVSRG